MKKKVAIIGSGVSGMTAGFELSKNMKFIFMKKIHILVATLILMK